MNFSNKKFFKLVLGLGNNSLEEIEQLCEIYSQAGADIFDLSPNLDSLNAARKGVKKAGFSPDDFKYCISFGVKGDVHIKKAKIKSENCKKCFECIKKCPQNAIYIEKNYPKISEEKCIGCQKCKEDCIEFHDIEVDIEKTAKSLEGKKLDIVELHISSYDKKEIIKKWKTVLRNFKCQKSICIDRSKYGDVELVELVKTLINMNSEKTIIQADGVPMSGANGVESTLQAVAHAQLYQNLDAYVFISGGTNCHTRKLADDLIVRYKGITIGSFARNSIKNCTRRDSLKIAKNIVNSVKL